VTLNTSIEDDVSTCASTAVGYELPQPCTALHNIGVTGSMSENAAAAQPSDSDNSVSPSTDDSAPKPAAPAELASAEENLASVETQLSLEKPSPTVHFAAEPAVPQASAPAAISEKKFDVAPLPSWDQWTGGSSKASTMSLVKEDSSASQESWGTLKSSWQAGGASQDSWATKGWSDLSANVAPMQRYFGDLGTGLVQAAAGPKLISIGLRRTRRKSHHAN